MKNYKLKPKDYIFLVMGISFIILAVLLVFATNGHEDLFVKIMIAVGVLFIVGGFVIGFVPGAGIALVIFVIIVKLMEWFPYVVAGLMGIGGIALIVSWFRESISVTGSSSSKPVRKKSGSKWQSYKNKTPIYSIPVEYVTIMDEFKDMEVGSELDFVYDDKRNKYSFEYKGSTLYEIPLRYEELILPYAKRGTAFFIIESDKNVGGYHSKINARIGIFEE